MNILKWTHIMDARPNDKTVIIQCDSPEEASWYRECDFKKHYTMGMRTYDSFGQSWEEFLAYSRKEGWRDPNFYWVYAKDFPFPK